MDDDDPRPEFLRAIGALSGGTRNPLSAADRGQGFVDVVQRLMGGGLVFGGGLAGSRDNGEIDALINNLNQREDTYIILETLNELSERLLMMNGITAERLIPANKLAKSLVNIMEDPILAEELELHLVACRCLYNFLEVNQDFIHDALNNHAIEALCSKLMEISYIDLTEQALQTLEMISRDPISHNSIIANNGLIACLQYLDFLTIHAQRKCLSVVSNSCTNISVANFQKVKDIMDNISEVVKNHTDAVVVENAWLTISRIIISFKTKPDLLEDLFSNKELLLKNLTQVVYVSCNKSSNTSTDNETSKVALNYSSCLSLIKSLIILSSTSVEISKILLGECAIGKVIVKSLNKYAKKAKTAIPPPSSQADESLKQVSETISIEALMAAPKELLSQFLNLIGYLLPINYAPSDTPFLRNNHEDFEEKQALNKSRISLCKEISPDDYWQFVNDVWHLLISSFQATMDYEIRRKVFINVFRIISFNSEDDFSKINDVELITNILASVANQSKGSIGKEFSERKATLATPLLKEDEEMVSSDEGEGLLSRSDEVDRFFDEEHEDEEEVEGVEEEVDEDVEQFEGDHDSEEDKEDENEEEVDGEEDNDVEEEDDEDDDEDEDDDDDDDNDDGADDDDDEEDEGDDDEEDEDNELQNQSGRRGNNSTDDVSSLNANVLLLSGLLTAKVLIERAPQSFLHGFEREGLINDIFLIVRALKGKIENSTPEPESTIRIHSISASYSNKYIDTEFTKEYEYKLTNKSVLSKISVVAAQIEQLYSLAKNCGNSSNAAEHMKILSEIDLTLKDQRLLKGLTFDNWKQLWERLKYALNGASSRVQISSFELISSGIIESLANIFTSDSYDFGFEFNDCYKAFISVFFVDRNQDAASFLVTKLQEALTRSESFEIISSGSTNVANIGSYFQNNDTTQTAIMAKQIKLKLIAAGDTDDKLPPSMQNMILSVHAIATFKSVDTFLKQRFRFMQEITGGIREISDNNNTTGNDGDSKKSAINIEFLLNGEAIPNEITIYGAIYRSLQSKPDEIVDPSRIWSTVHNITYRRISSAVTKEPKLLNYSFHIKENELDIYDRTTIHTLQLLKVLFEMNAFVKGNIYNGVVIPENDFMNWKLTVKLNRQLEEPLVVASGTLPGWSIHVTKQFPFIFPLETRIFFLQSTSFGYSRLIHHWQIRTNQANDDNSTTNSSGQRAQLGRPTRHKVRISRKMILQSAVKVLGLYGSTPGTLEIEYFDEVGSGLGPTLEFYATVSKEFSKKKLKLWRDNDSSNTEEEAYVSNALGFFPSPLDKHQIANENGRKVLYFYSSLGKFVARALLDSRIVDFNFNTVFLKLVQYFNHNGAQKTSHRNLKKMANIASLRLVDPELADSLEHLYKYVKQFPQVEESERDSIVVDGATIKDLSLYFELPGYPDFELFPGGSEIQVDASNLELYITRILEATLYSGIFHQTKAFMDGFSKVFPVNSLIIFSPEELAGLFGGAEEDWSVDTLTSAISANHGYTKESDAIKSLIKILVEFTETERRAFLQFLTGAPKLPIGGFKALRPELTVVRKHAEGNLKDDDYLPSVMTCANYLKLPEYSSEKLMKERLLQAINEGAGAFLLS
ncbi:Ufd4 protein [Scheffersomyces xylosifermentans]|uniref:Ufd4 protein n=1 Tax=Scheffersomyces xylosifermentans TaxID=1304137 RepID=UPI00315D7148